MKMTSLLSQNINIVIRPVQYRDLDHIERLSQESFAAQNPSDDLFATQQAQKLRHNFGLFKFLNIPFSQIRLVRCRYSR